MARNKYLKDYRLLESVDEKGRIRTDYEYIGDPWRYAGGAEAAMAGKKRAALGCLIGWAAFVGALLPNSAGMHTLFVSMPFVFTALALGLLTETVLSAMPKSEPFQHRQADKLQNRYPPAALVTALLPMISLAGELVNLLRGLSLNGGDAVFCLCAAVCAGCGLYAFSLRGRFAVRKG